MKKFLLQLSFLVFASPLPFVSGIQNSTPSSSKHFSMRLSSSPLAQWIEGLNYELPKIDLECTVDLHLSKSASPASTEFGPEENTPLSFYVRCRASREWKGYKKGGNENEPFTGIPFEYTLEATSGGITINFMKSFLALNPTLKTVSPANEFLVKAALLLFTATQDASYTPECVAQELGILIKRLALTPGRESITSHPVFGNILSLYALHPLSASTFLVAHAQKIVSLCGLTTQTLPTQYQEFIARFINEASLASKTITLPLFKQDELLSFSLGETGIGTVDTPLPLATVVIERQDGQNRIRDTYTLESEVTALLKMIIIVIDGYKEQRSSNEISQQLNTTILRLNASNPQRMPQLCAFLGRCAGMYHSITTYDFEQAQSAPLDIYGVALYIAAAWYAVLWQQTITTPTATVTTPQERSAFLSAHCGYALRQYLLTHYHHSFFHSLLYGKRSAGKHIHFQPKVFLQALLSKPA